MKTQNYKKSRARGVLTGFLSIAMIVAGVALIGSFLFAGGMGSVASNDSEPGGFNVPSLDASGGADASGPEDKPSGSPSRT